MRMDARFTFDRLVVGGANRLAVSAARAVAELHGREAEGKTLKVRAS